jgi:hypothetical protein
MTVYSNVMLRLVIIIVNHCYVTFVQKQLYNFTQSVFRFGGVVGGQ